MTGNNDTGNNVIKRTNMCMGQLLATKIPSYNRKEEKYFTNDVRASLQR